MKIKKLQEKAKEYANYNPASMSGLLEATWLVEEAAEVLKEFRTAIKNNKELDQKYVKEEMGDTVIALMHIANALNFDFNEIAKDALKKQQERMEEESKE